MAYLTVEDVVNLRISEIRDRFPNVRMEFIYKELPEHPELWVNVFDSSRYSEVAKYCRAIEVGNIDPRLATIRIKPKKWSGAWPGGESIDDLERKRRLLSKQTR